MKHGTHTRTWGLRAAAAVGCVACLATGTAAGRSLLSDDGRSTAVIREHTVQYQTGFRPVGAWSTGGATSTGSPTTANGSPAASAGGPATHAFANRSKVFGLVTPSDVPNQVLFATAKREQPGGPETVTPAEVGSYQQVALAPGAEIRVTAPIANDGVTDWVHGIQVTPQQFADLYRQSEQKYGHILDRGHMFELSFDAQGRVTRMIHYFSP